MKVNNRAVKHRIRVVTFNTGLIIKNGRNKLANKRYAYIITTSSKIITATYFSDFLLSKVNEFYQFNNITLKLGGDGAVWVKNVAGVIGAEYVADNYHAVKCLVNIFINGKGKYTSRNWSQYFKSKALLRSGNYQQLMTVLENNKIDKGMLNYFKRSKSGIINQNATWNIGVSAESDVFHLVKSNCAGGRIFSDKHFKNMIKAQADLLNEK